ncbi:MAG TPA: hypothetical protein VFS00_23410, partial [Polyangiaceae bacterium]|nr:hypothetical protein [Polyangiaceae bacterium]
QFLPVGGLEPADPLSATDPGLGWPSVTGTRPPVSRRGRGPIGSAPDRMPLSSPSPARSQAESSAAFAALAPNPTVVPATVRASQADTGPAAPRPRTRFPTWLVLLAVVGGGTYHFRDDLVPHLDPWSARGAVSSVGSAPNGQPDGAPPRPDGEATDLAAQAPKGTTPPEAPPPPDAATAPEASAPAAPPVPPPPGEADGAVPAVDASAPAGSNGPLPVLFPPPPSASAPPAKPPTQAAPPSKPPTQQKKNTPSKPPPRSKTTPKSPSKGHKR